MTIERVFIAIAMTALNRADLVAWVTRYRQQIDKLADGEAVIAHARQRYSDLPKEELAA